LRKSRVDLEEEAKAALKGEKYDTLNRHRKELLRFASKYELIIVDIFEEVTSGSTIEDRQAMQELLENVALKKYDAVLCIAYDRLSRGDKEDQGKIENTLKKFDTLIITPSKIYDLNSEEGETSAEIDGFISRMEYRRIRKRLEDGKKRSILEGKDVSNKQPYGYSKDKETKKLIPNEYAQNVKLIFELYDNIGTLHGVVEELYKLGIPTKDGKDRWTYVTIKRMLKNKKYIGIMFFNQTRKRDYIEYPNSHTPIVDEELFFRVNKQLLEVKDHKTNKVYTLKNPFAGLGRCGICGNVTKLHNLTYKYIRCSNYHCENKFIRFEEYEQKFISRLEQILKSIEIDPTEIETMDNKLDTLNLQLDLLHKEKEKLQRREKNIYISFEDETYTKDVFKQRLDELNEEKIELDGKIANMLEVIEYEKSQLDRISNIAPTIQNCLDVYYLSNPEQRNRLLKSFVKEIITTKPVKYKDFEMQIILRD
jgi:DNA invertase Pin-like site-specific DNA recombinase